MAKFQVKKSTFSYYYHLRASGNNEIILRGENYSSKQACETGIASVKVNAQYDVRYEKLYSIDRQWYFNLKGGNGEIIGTSETYKSSTARDEGIALVKAQAPFAIIEDLTYSNV